MLRHLTEALAGARTSRNRGLVIGIIEEGMPVLVRHVVLGTERTLPRGPNYLPLTLSEPAAFDRLESEPSNMEFCVHGPRANWKGFLRLSLVTCPVALYPATSESEKISAARRTGWKWSVDHDERATPGS
ncbi:hypothetical protein BRDID11004_70280 [Bradyrhizobium diazoefficiens]|uniref:Uncharacterized protein n=1 Tax=Bradyrhizobium diazoefficiens TaxID=1355477 RepID=A0A809ZPG2_9BRAD|nr:hypothetical protein F07S3_16750 [Bradyrhizobium diazoefficiens]BCA09827.1 hypothetical protein BDHF08_16740 [Bradyrhizobium diazoefficiens]BCE54165.1 hypothetical protein XF5B_16770 [Bradyrhizobium diazoefficiens]BCE62890.1 hypothetical protein XF6B_16890 [Bradyrhizobium diazoefficiens]